MISHLFKLIWNKKKAHALLLIEIWAAFMVLFGLASLMVVNIRNYNQPLGFAYENVWSVNLDNNLDTVDVSAKTERIRQRLKAYAEVESITRMSNNSPFSANTMNNNVTYDKASGLADFYITDENFASTLNMALVAGRWYRNADSIGKYKPVVINKKLQESLFEQENPLGKLVSSGDNKYRVIGVVGNFKAKGEFMTNNPALFELLNAKDAWHQRMLIRVKPGTDALFEARLVKDVAAMAEGWSVEVDRLVESRQNQHNLTLVPVIIALIVCGFLLINVALGLFGVLNVSITRRRGEIGLRRAMGATGSNISTQFVGEIWVLATFGMLIGLLFAVQFPLMNVFDVEAGVYMTAILASVIVIYLIVTLCAFYPSRQAAAVQPAVALHEE